MILKVMNRLGSEDSLGTFKICSIVLGGYHESGVKCIDGFQRNKKRGRCGSGESPCDDERDHGHDDSSDVWSISSSIFDDGNDAEADIFCPVKHSVASIHPCSVSTKGKGSSTTAQFLLGRPCLGSYRDESAHTSTSSNSKSHHRQSLNHLPIVKIHDILAKIPTWRKADASLMAAAMLKSRQSQTLLQDWDHLHGLPKSHSCTMTHTSRSRRQLEEGQILPKWNGKPSTDNGKTSRRTTTNSDRRRRRTQQQRQRR